MAKDIIKQRHPLMDTPLYEVFAPLYPVRFLFPSYQRKKGIGFSEASRLSGDIDADAEDGEEQPLVQR